MGVFILCWLPFFTTHILMGLCGQTCDINEDLVYSIVTWLGWLNSAMNPVIYACWSRDFRRAFRKVLCGFRGRAAGGGSAQFGGSQFYGRFSKHNHKSRTRQVTAFAINSEMQRTNTENRRRRLMELNRLQKSRTSATSSTDISSEGYGRRDSNNNAHGVDDAYDDSDGGQRQPEVDGAEGVIGRSGRSGGRFSRNSEMNTSGATSERRQLDRLAAWEALKTGLQPIPELSGTFDSSSPMISPCVERVKEEEGDAALAAEVSRPEVKQSSTSEDSVQGSEVDDGPTEDKQVDGESIASATAPNSDDEITIRIRLDDGQVSIQSSK
jgi:hypothetical protein